MSDVRICERDGQPLVWTFEFPGAEWFCVVCGGHEDLFGGRVPWTADVQRRLDELTDQYNRERAEREGRDYAPPPKAGDDGVELPVCLGCGAVPPEGIALVGGKPSKWFSRTVDGVTTYACKTSCIPASEPVSPW